jgi:hypothetical protein
MVDVCTDAMEELFKTLHQRAAVVLEDTGGVILRDVWRRGGKVGRGKG